MIAERILPLETQFANLRTAVEQERQALVALQGQHQAMVSQVARLEQEHGRYHFTVDEMESDVKKLKA